MTPWERGYAAYKAGCTAEIPTGKSDWATRLFNAGWCAARRNVTALGQTPARVEAE